MAARRAGAAARGPAADESPAGSVAGRGLGRTPFRLPVRPIEPERDRYLRLIRKALERAVASLAARDRLRLACYYAQELTLAQTGRILGEHEATASRELARTRAAIRDAVERHLRVEAGLTDAEIAGVSNASPRTRVRWTCASCSMRVAVGDSGRKESALDRSQLRGRRRERLA